MRHQSAMKSHRSNPEHSCYAPSGSIELHCEAPIKFAINSSHSIKLPSNRNQTQIRKHNKMQFRLSLLLTLCLACRLTKQHLLSIAAGHSDLTKCQFIKFVEPTCQMAVKGQIYASPFVKQLCAISAPIARGQHNPTFVGKNAGSTRAKFRQGV